MGFIHSQQTDCRVRAAGAPQAVALDRKENSTAEKSPKTGRDVAQEELRLLRKQKGEQIKGQQRLCFLCNAFYGTRNVLLTVVRG